MADIQDIKEKTRQFLQTRKSAEKVVNNLDGQLREATKGLPPFSTPAQSFGGYSYRYTNPTGLEATNGGGGGPWQALSEMPEAWVTFALASQAIVDDTDAAVGGLTP